MRNADLQKAKKAKNDEFYTRLVDIADELKHYKPHFQDKVVYCNCDDPTWSNFWNFFHLNFAEYGLKALISTHITFDNSPSYIKTYTGGDDNDLTSGTITPLEGNGDFRSPECIDILKQADIVVTNPPFSLFREYLATLLAHEKHFLIIGSQNIMTYKDTFPLIKDRLVWSGYNAVKTFTNPAQTEAKFGNVCWFTNLDIQKCHEKLILYKNFTPEEYPRYDNYLAWNVDKVSDIPRDEYIDIEIDPSELEAYRAVYPDLEVLPDEDTST